MLTVSLAFADASVLRIIVIVVVVIVTHALVISLAAVYVTLPVVESKIHHVAIVNIIVQLFIFAGISPFAHSAILICHSQLQDGLIALFALSADIFVPLVAAVTVTVA